MFDLIALAFDADITRSVTFMLNREDGMGISDTFPLKLGLSKTHHNLSHADGQGRATGFRQVRPVPEPAVGALLRTSDRVPGPQRQRARQHDRAVRQRREHDAQSAQPADADRRRRQHGPQARAPTGEHGETRMSNVYLSILRSLGIEQESFADSTGTLSGSIFSV